jgi:hypothetical protein
MANVLQLVRAWEDYTCTHATLGSPPPPLTLASHRTGIGFSKLAEPRDHLCPVYELSIFLTLTNMNMNGFIEAETFCGVGQRLRSFGCSTLVASYSVCLPPLHFISSRCMFVSSRVFIKERSLLTQHILCACHSVQEHCVPDQVFPTLSTSVHRWCDSRPPEAYLLWSYISTTTSQWWFLPWHRKLLWRHVRQHRQPVL